MQTSQLVENQQVTEQEFIAIRDFIACYRELEKQPLQIGYNFLTLVFKEQPLKNIIHFHNHWKSKKKCFSSFFLNLDTNNQILIQRFWRIQDDSEAAYSDYKKQMDLHWQREEMDAYSEMAFNEYYNRPRVNVMLHNLLLYFHNYGIGGQGHFPNIPKSQEKRFGNSANWGDYFLSLLPGHQKEVITNILNYR